MGPAQLEEGPDRGAIGSIADLPGRGRQKIGPARAIMPRGDIKLFHAKDL
jgi:hypothetical protein